MEVLEGREEKSSDQKEEEEEEQQDQHQRLILTRWKFEVNESEKYVFKIGLAYSYLALSVWFLHQLHRQSGLFNSVETQIGLETRKNLKRLFAFQ
ncbi:hypothetical protein RUM43_003927 [Polyplax serrata]|uniref:Uncharacterized protein n=1 Tax=Polyplax serrata TaxID=468196 RepID=A0AAN8PZ38_POLSC